MRDPHYRTCFGVSSPGVPFNSGVANQRPLFVLPHSIFVVALLIAGSMAPLPASLIMKLRHERIDASEGHSSFARLTVNKHSFGTSKHFDAWFERLLADLSLLSAANVTARRCRQQALEQIFQFFEMAWQIIVDSPDRQTIVTLTNYRSRPVITAREVPDGKSSCAF